MRGFAVIGANYGDEGKGLIVDWLCREVGAELVVRFNGGAQAGHTVALPDGRRHVFSHWGAGTFAGAATYLAPRFVVNPILFAQEAVRWTWDRPRIYVHPDCPVTTPWDMMLNQHREATRGGARHGSCGVGFGETVARCEHPESALLVRDLEDVKEEKWVKIGLWFRSAFTAAGIPTPIEAGDMVHRFAQDCAAFLRAVTVTAEPPISNARIVFEGAQGLGLDAVRGAFPHVTRSRTGVLWAAEAALELEIDLEEVWYVTRSYLTRHGAGPLPGECQRSDLPGVPEDLTNVVHPWQGRVRYGLMDASDLADRVIADGPYIPSSAKVKLAITCLDQLPSRAARRGLGLPGAESAGPTHADVRRVA